MPEREPNEAPCNRGMWLVIDQTLFVIMLWRTTKRSLGYIEARSDKHQRCNRVRV
jgi:hypothetical protein